MTAVEDILGSDERPKEKVARLVTMAREDYGVLGELARLYDGASKPMKGSCMEAISEVSKVDPAAVAPHMGFLIAHVNDALPRVRWEAAQAIGNAARASPAEASVAIPSIMRNTSDEGTVVRWSAAYALGEIAKADPRARAALLPKLERLARDEKNNGVRNVYLKALTQMEKGRPRGR